MKGEQAMASQFMGLNIAASGLRTASVAMNTTGNNITNVDTTGYSKQTVTQQASNALRSFASYGCVGAGVDTLTIERARNEFYDSRYRNNATQLGEYTQKDYYSSLVEDYMNDNGTTGFSSLFNKMSSSLQSVMTAAGTSTTKTAYLSSVTSVTEYFNTVSAQLNQMQSNTNDEIKVRIDSINSIAQEISTLNQQINTIERTGSAANNLRDRRDSLVDDLSKICNVSIKEEKVVDKNNPDSDTGVTRYQVYIAGGQNLVDDDGYRQLVCVAGQDEDSTNQNDVSGLYSIKWASATYRDGSQIFFGDFDLGNSNIGGELEGLINIRDGNNGAIFKGTSTAWDDATNTVTLGVSSSYLKDMNKCTLPDKGSIDIGGRTYYYDSWDYDGDSSYTFVLSEKNPDGTAQDTSRVDAGQTGSIGDSVNYQGIPYYMAQMNEWIRSFSSKINSIMENGFTEDGQNGIYMLTGNKNSTDQYTYSDLSGSNKGYNSLTASNFAVNSTLSGDSDRLATKTDKTEGADEFGNLSSVYEMMTSKKVFRGTTAGDFLTKVLADVSLNSSNASSMKSTYSALSKTLENQRQSVSGVDSDEEAAALTKYQNSYNLSSKLLQTLTEMYDQLILSTGV